jgi:hypothetical protein
MSQELPKITTYFWLTSKQDFDPTIVAQRVPISSARVERRGDARPSPRPSVQQSSWRIACEDRRIQSIDEGVKEVLDLVSPYRAEILGVLSDFSLSSSFVSYVRIYELGVVFELLPDTMERMLELHAEWNMDLYDFSE